jgi:hypothetical protein
MSADQYKEYDFEILREPWNKYELEDGSYIKARYILTKYKKTEPDAQGRTKYQAEFQTLTVVYNVPESLKGPPVAEQFSQEQLQQSIEREVSYKTMEEEWNEYIADDGTKIRVKDTVTRVSRTKLRDAQGNPIYWVEHSQLLSSAPLKK